MKDFKRIDLNLNSVGGINLLQEYLHPLNYSLRTINLTVGYLKFNYVLELLSNVTQTI